MRTWMYTERSPPNETCALHPDTYTCGIARRQWHLPQGLTAGCQTCVALGENGCIETWDADHLVACLSVPVVPEGTW